MATERTFETYIAQERDRLAKRRAEAEARITEVQQELDDIAKEQRAIDAYEAVKTGRSVPTTTARTRAPSATGRRSGIRDDVYNAVASAGPNGIKAAEVRAKLGITDKSGSQSVANALSALKRRNRIADKGGSYVAA